MFQYPSYLETKRCKHISLILVNLLTQIQVKFTLSNKNAIDIKNLWGGMFRRLKVQMILVVV